MRERMTPSDEARGIAWWNLLSVAERADWLRRAAEQGDVQPSAADAYRAYRCQQEAGVSKTVDCETPRPRPNEKPQGGA